MGGKEGKKKRGVKNEGVGEDECEEGAFYLEEASAPDGVRREPAFGAATRALETERRDRSSIVRSLIYRS